MRRQFPRNTINRKQRYVLSFDTETQAQDWGDGQKRLTWKLGSGWFVDRRMGNPCHCVTSHRLELVKFILDSVPKRGTLWCYAHNLWFDFKVVGLHKILPKLGWELTWFYFSQGGGSAIIVFKKGVQKIAFLNSYNYFQMPLKKMGEIVGLPKLDVNLETITDEELSTYCLRDSEIVLQSILLLMDRVETVFGVRLEYTSGSTSIAAWRNLDKGGSVYFHDISSITEWEHAAIHGGRTEAWTIGKIKDTVSCFDVTSMYPYVMLNIPMPTKIRRSYNVRPTDRHIDNPERWHKSLSEFSMGNSGCYDRQGWTRVGIMARALVEVDRPVFPVRANGRLVFPTGQFTTTLAPVEFDYALARGWVKAVYAATVYDLGSPFSRTLGLWWKARSEALRAGNKAEATMIKLIGNSLYGKFAQRAIEELWREPCDPDSVKSEPLAYEGQSGSIWELCGTRVYMLNTSEPTKQTHYPIASQILAGARLRLWEFIEEAGLENVHYMDTDSLMVTGLGRDRLATHCSDRLGDLKLEWTDNRVEIFGPKDYRTSAFSKTKGISGKAEYILHLDSWRQTQFVGVRGDMARQNADGIIIRLTQKHLERKYRKGTVLPSGRVVPFRLKA